MQRVKPASELGKRKRGKYNLYILDEPTTGLHIAHIKTADHFIDLGPEGSHKRGKLMAVWTPEKVAKSKTSYTGRFLKKHL